MDKNSETWHQYYQKVLTKKHSLETENAHQFNRSGCKVAIDCGCGTGSDIAYLAQQGYQVHGFDNNEDAIGLCRDRFADQPSINISLSTFETFRYPQAGVVLAHNSLFFAEPEAFPDTWQSISNSLKTGGVFSGDFMGEKDSWAHGFRIATTPLTELQVEALFKDFDIIQFQERDETGPTALGRIKHWHTFSVLAVKKAASN
ncbi:class I SAM-dependent methyltransferase [Vibrio coralliilyticus]|uniref:class I SAM-dependent methyltransferase n=1 Tax=Vibrio coralliilyticus TaxID=190893 RepID=UPI00148B4FFA|nr:class I SAM-dependent methyltransferase [Vibrio coralliilyticus]NOI27184.1 class I SAM-dependent methyltransferase [Vibrio coralliilyticus]NOI46525.1 class I SAM-dependent methyltransferase [Vibrio coralliilyticus]